MYNKKKNEEKKSLVSIFELIMQKKTVRLYFIENTYDNDDLIVHVHHGRSQLGALLCKTRTADALLSLWLEKTIG
jgi:hypothetical protein